MQAIAAGQRGGDTFFSNPWLALSMLTAVGMALLAGGTAAAGIFGERERSIIGFLALFIGLFVLVLTLGEIFPPH